MTAGFTLSSSNADEANSRLPLTYEDGPDYCMVKDAQGRDFALTLQPDLMKAMERALSEDIAELSRPPGVRLTGGGDFEELKRQALSAADGIDHLQDSRSLRRRTAEIIRELVGALSPQARAGDNTCYLERSKVREVLLGDPTLTGKFLHQMDALPIFTEADFREVAQETGGCQMLNKQITWIETQVGKPKCDCAIMCEDKGIQGGCRYIRPDLHYLRKLVDLVWQEANETAAVPSTDWADSMIDRATAVTRPHRQKEGE